MKSKFKKTLTNIFVAIVFAGAAIFSMKYFNLWNKVSDMIIPSEGISISDIYIYKPKVKIVDLNSNSRSIGVSINNNHDSWPHAGLQDAYLCYELIAEGGITRILAFYKDKDIEKIGSVRSARHYFLDYVLENDAIFVHYGQSPQALSDLKSLGIDNINGIYDTTSFFRDKTLNKPFEHTAFTKMSGIKKSIQKYKYRDTSDSMLLRYSPIKINYNEDKTIVDANTVTIEYSTYTTTKYVYDSENMVYKQYMSNVAQNDAVTGKQYTVKNIITYKVRNSSIDSHDRQNLYNTGSGEGYYITNGKAIKIKWEKKDRSSKTKYTDLSGNELTINDGNTWIHIEPSDKKLNIE